MKDAEEKAKQFWIYQSAQDHVTEYEPDVAKWKQQFIDEDLLHHPEIIHVIEYSALESAQKKIVHLENTINEVTNAAQLSNLKLKDELEQAQKRIDELLKESEEDNIKWENDCEKLKDAQKKIDELEAISSNDSLIMKDLYNQQKSTLKMIEEMAGALETVMCDTQDQHIIKLADDALENYRKWKEGMK